MPAPALAATAEDAAAPPLDLTTPATVAATEQGGARSAGRRGLKREFAFALKAHNDLSSPMSRTRSGKIRRQLGPGASTSARFGGQVNSSAAPSTEGSSAAAPIVVDKPEDAEGVPSETFGAAGTPGAVMKEPEVAKEREAHMNENGIVRLVRTSSKEMGESENSSTIVSLADEETPIETVLPDNDKQVGPPNLEVVEVPLPILVEEPSEEFVDAIDGFETDDGVSSVTGGDELRVESSAADHAEMEADTTTPSPCNNEVGGESTARNDDVNKATTGSDPESEKLNDVGTTSDLNRKKDDTAVKTMAVGNSGEDVLAENSRCVPDCQNESNAENAVMADIVDQSQMKDTNAKNIRGRTASTRLPKASRRITRSFLKTGAKSENEAKVEMATANSREIEMLVQPKGAANGGETGSAMETASEVNDCENLKGAGTTADVNRNVNEAVTGKVFETNSGVDPMEMDPTNFLDGRNGVKAENAVPAVGQRRKKVADVSDVNGHNAHVTRVMPSRRVTRSFLKSMTEETPQTPVSGEGKDVSKSASAAKVTSQVETESRLASTGGRRPQTRVKAQPNGGPAPRSLDEETPQLQETPHVDGGILATGTPQNPVTVPIEKEYNLDTPVTINNLGESVNGMKVESIMPARRFTRSLLKGKADEAHPLKETVTVSSTETSEESDGKSTVVNEPNGSLSTPLKKKMELKMSKKITLTKLPANVRELLGTGLLEGLNVTYMTSNNRSWLRGVIKDGAILCYCTTCRGTNAVSAYQFELHAGSTKKHPSDYITLENGRSINDIIRACANAPLDMLETTIRSAISSETNKGSETNKVSKCQQCNRSFQTSRIGKLSSVCDSCLVERLSKSPLPVDSSENISKNVSLQKKITSQGRMTTKDLWLHKLVFMNETLPDGTEVGYYNRGKRLLEGYIRGSGIFCSCCNTVVSPSQFEAHAGFPARRKPYLNIYTSNGVSLHELSVSLSKDKKYSTRENDDLCQICASGGNLLLCDLCPRAYHKECVGLSSLPDAEWYCPCCQAMHQREKYVSHNKNAIAAGRVSGVDPIEEIFKRCIRIVQTPEIDASCCVLCRGHDFSKSEFGPRTVLLCDQCEKEFHIGCLKEHNIADLKELPQGTWFCCSDCDRIYAALHEPHACEPKQISDRILDVIKRKRTEKGLSNDSELDVRWRLIKGSTASPESSVTLSEATAIFHESFDPIIDLATHQDLIPAMVYGKDIGHQDFTGMYCAVLTISSTVVSAGLLRILGRGVAELPLVATSMASQGHGCFQTLFSCIEELLVSLGVERLVLPATKEAEAIWVNKFGFQEINQVQLEECTKGTRPMNFQGTPMLHKLISCSEIQSTAEG